MTQREPPTVDCHKHHATVRVSDVLAALEFYTTRLGFRHGFTWGEPPAMASVFLDEVEIFLSRGTPDPEGTAVYFVVGDADALHEFQHASGANVVEALQDRPWQLRDYTVRDPWGNHLTFGHHLPAREPPLEIERVDVPVRLERRLAAVLADLATSKRMTIGECLEETLLHTFEPFDDGENVPSPHTPSELRRIAELKRKHGVDYDCHASYRFVERPSGT